MQKDESEKNHTPNTAEQDKNEELYLEQAPQSPVMQAPRQVRVKSFKTSHMKQPMQLKAYFFEVVKNPFNNFCIECKNNKSTHVIVWLGAYVCGQCASEICESQGGNQYCYVKDIFGEQWDDYQLLSLAYGGNKPLFDFQQEYGMEEKSLKENYSTPQLKWYREQLQSKMDRKPLNKPKPAKNLDEQIEQSKEAVKDNINSAHDTYSDKIQSFKESIQQKESYQEMTKTMTEQREIIVKETEAVAAPVEDAASKAFQLHDQFIEKVAQSEQFDKLITGLGQSYTKIGSSAFSFKEKMKSKKWEMPKVPAMPARFSFRRQPTADDVEEVQNNYTGVQLPKRGQFPIEQDQITSDFQFEKN